MLLSLVFIPFLLAAPQGTPAAPADLHTTFDNLKAAEQKKDIDEIKKLAVEASNAARKLIQSPQPAQADEIEVWKSQVEFAKQVEPYADYAIYAAALQVGDRAKMMELFEVLDKQSPKSQYVSQLYGLYLGAVSQGPGGSAKAYEFASKAIGRDPNNEDLLAVLADGAMTRKQFERSATYGAKLAAVMSTHGKPEGVPAGDWERKRSAMVGRGYWIAGMSYASVNKHGLADKNLRAALPYIKGDAALMNGANFYLGVANYNLARAIQDKVLMKQALAFSEAAFQAGGQYSQAASQNIYAIKQELGRMR